MKTFRSLMLAALFMVVSILAMTGCEYDVAQPQWEKPYTEPPTPVIRQIQPAQRAMPGVNIITILGENFAEAPETNDVYFDNLLVEIIETSATAIKVRRPNLVSDTSVVKVVASNAFLVAKSGPYKIDPVLARYGSFLENLPLSIVAVDQAENVYVVETTSREIIKVTPGGEQTVFGIATRAPWDATFGPDGRLYLPGNNRSIDVVDLQSGAIANWLQLPSGKVVRFGDFDANGYFYTGGARTDLVIVAPDLTNRNSGAYPSPIEILAVRVFNGYVYVASRTSNQAAAVITRHALDASGNLGSKETVLDFATAGDEFASRSVRAIAFSADGRLFIATDSADPILVVDPATGQPDVFYKSILPSNCKQFGWGAGNYLYMITGDTALGEEWTVYQVDMGITAGAR